MIEYGDCQGTVHGTIFFFPSPSLRQPARVGFRLRDLGRHKRTLELEINARRNTSLHPFDSRSALPCVFKTLHQTSQLDMLPKDTQGL